MAASTGALYEAIRSPEPIALPEQPAISPQLTDLLTRLLDKDRATRMTLDEVSALVSTHHLSLGLHHALLIMSVLVFLLHGSRQPEWPLQTCIWGTAPATLVVAC